MIALELSVPVACWRKGHARSFFESEEIPPPSTCYGALLSLVGETDRDRHKGVRVTGGIVGRPAVSTVLRKMWRIKTKSQCQGVGENVTPDFQQLVLQSRIVVLVDSCDERGERPHLEERVRIALDDPSLIDRFGAWCLGESTHLINEVKKIVSLPDGTRCFVEDTKGDLSLPVWVDHVGSKGTVYAIGRLELACGELPPAAGVPVIRDC